MKDATFLFRKYKYLKHIFMFVYTCAMCISLVGFAFGPVVKNLPVNVEDTRDTGLIPESERSPGEGNGNPLQPAGYSP